MKRGAHAFLPCCLYAICHVYACICLDFCCKYCKYSVNNTVKIPPIRVICLVLYCVVLLHIPLGIATFSFHCALCLGVCDH